ncbi:hypothetical protein OROMI_001382 [Orobanche minor]
MTSADLQMTLFPTIMEYVPKYMYHVLKHYSDMNQKMPLIYVKLYTYEIFRGLAYMHSVVGVCHRHVMPHNVLADPQTHQVRICDFGSAKGISNRSCFQVAAILSKSPYTALEACAHLFFDELREPNVRLQMVDHCRLHLTSKRRQDFYSSSSSLALDAHKVDLEVFPSNFMNDASLPYDYNYDPVAQYLSFVDNGQFFVDNCFSHMDKNATVQAKFWIISSEGASGDYPGCSDKEYAKAISDGVDILDCPVQMTSDGIPFCLGSINLKDKTNAAEFKFSNMATTIRDLKIKKGIFAYSLTWSHI